MTPLLGQKNLGPTIIQYLESVGISSLEDIERASIPRIYETLQKKYPKKVFPVCYYLYSLEGALTGTHWADIPETRKRALRNAVGKK